MRIIEVLFKDGSVQQFAGDNLQSVLDMAYMIGNIACIMTV